MTAKTVGDVAALTGVSVRALHHYDHIGLVVPSERNHAGYRGYNDADVERLHLVLVYRAAGVTLDAIGALLDDPGIDVVAHLRRQHELLQQRAAELAHTLTALETLMDAHRSGIRLTAEEQVEIFGTTAFAREYAEEAQQRWGDTDAWRQSRERAAGLSSHDWRQVRADGDELLARLVAAKRDGVRPGSAGAAELVAAHRDSIARFYDCDDAMHVCLAQMYLADERFTRYYDDAEPGLTQFVHDIVVAAYSAT